MAGPDDVGDLLPKLKERVERLLRHETEMLGGLAVQATDQALSSYLNALRAHREGTSDEEEEALDPELARLFEPKQLLMNERE